MMSGMRWMVWALLLAGCVTRPIESGTGDEPEPNTTIPGAPAGGGGTIDPVTGVTPGGGGGAERDDNVVDADFEEVEEDKKKSA